MKFSFRHHYLAAAALAAVCLAGARAEDSVSKIKFSDPSKPGTLKIAVARGDIVVDGGDASEITVKSDAQPKRRTNKEGLRVLTEAATFSISEKDNVATIDAASDGWMGTPSDLRVAVPRGTTVVIASSMGGDVTCSGVTGDIEVKSLQGNVKLNDVAGAVLVETMSGDVTANFRELHDGKGVSFTSMNGKVVLRVPASAKANVRLRTQNGTIATDFDENALVTKVEAVTGQRTRSTGALTAEAREAFKLAARASAEAARRATEAVREAAEAAREGADDEHPTARHPKVIAPRAPMPPAVPAIPAVTGGKLVTGTLNGGGPEISVATMNGDVTLRQLK